MLGLRRRIAIFCAKSVGMIIRKCSSRRGSVLPGYVAQLIDPDILQEMAEMVRYHLEEKNMFQLVVQMVEMAETELA